jgi:hypothetical protein
MSASIRDAGFGEIIVTMIVLTICVCVMKSCGVF